jgi:hypothetical protein
MVSLLLETVSSQKFCSSQLRNRALDRASGAMDLRKILHTGENMGGADGLYSALSTDFADNSICQR